MKCSCSRSETAARSVANCRDWVQVGVRWALVKLSDEEEQAAMLCHRSPAQAQRRLPAPACSSHPGSGIPLMHYCSVLTRYTEAAVQAHTRLDGSSVLVVIVVVDWVLLAPASMIVGQLEAASGQVGTLAAWADARYSVQLCLPQRALVVVYWLPLLSAVLAPPL